MKRYASLLLLLLASPLFGQDISVSGDGVRVVKIDKVIVIKEDATIAQAFPVYFEAPKGGVLYAWSVPQGVTFTKAANKLTVTSAPKGLLTVGVDWAIIDFDKKTIDSKSATASVTVGDVPVPPGPDPKPNPDPVIPAPLPLAGVLMIEESDDRAKITKGQYNALFGSAMRDYINASVAKEDGQPALRILDKDQATLGMAKHWQDAAKKRPANFTTPWLIVSNGTTGWEGPMPADEAETKAILAKYLTAKGEVMESMPGNKIHDIRWSFGKLLHRLATGKWVAWFKKYGIQVTTEFHDCTATGVH